jgi:single-strand DNA-binding protein
MLIGRNTKEPELKFLSGSGTAICKFTIAVDRRIVKDKEKESDFFNCTAFGKTAEFIGANSGKGKKIYVEGRIQFGNYTNKEGNKVYTTDLIVEQTEIIEWMDKQDKPAEKTANKDFDNDMTPVDDGDIPF